MTERILVAMSGGVDSAVTAALLHREGFEVIGINMRVWGEDAPGTPAARRPCCSLAELNDARAVAQQIGIPFYALDLRAEFERAVIRPFVEEYLRGRTPNPCVLCNEDLKLGVLLEKAETYGCAAVATGHYARIDRHANGRWGIRRGVDPEKEQSYYLFRLSQRQLAHFRAPLGSMTKAQVRRLAAEFGLHIASKPGSQEICFIPDKDYRGFVRREAPPQRPDREGGQVPSQRPDREGGQYSDALPHGRASAVLEPGDIVDRSGRVLGRHTGIADYTIGQRRGLGIAHPTPLYVIGIDARRNRVIVGEKEKVFARELIASRLNWVALDRPAEPIAARVQIRYRHKAAPARVEPIPGDRVRVVFERPEPAITPGQAAVFYDLDNDWLLGGGWIE